ncbi:type III-A CRISPR-associated protein Cas10/Csm1 [Kandleria vitulina]|nr:type III-A CRISPR-associated protein Cas10/Csm1 [Kandleria vitulina]
MEYKLIDVAYGALLHDIGKFYQRSKEKSDLTDEEYESTPWNGIYHSHLHSGYTSRFMKESLHLFNEFEMLTSSHHKNENDVYAKIIKKADVIASNIDRQDEEEDTEENNKRGNFITSRLYSVLSEVDFGKDKADAYFMLDNIFSLKDPVTNFTRKDVKESALEYKKLFNGFKKVVEDNNYLYKRVDKVSYDYMYNYMYQYLSTVPASTFGNVKSSVSLFDHSRMTSAIASCIYLNGYDDKMTFNLLEIDVSGIQSFIFKIVEGRETRPGLTKALRGRSILVGLITNLISYAFIHEFGLTQSNILFNSGGGSTILLPSGDDVERRVEEVSKRIRETLYDYFKTDITFVADMILVNEKELHDFKSDLSVKLKEKLGRKKMKKFSDIIAYDKDFFFKKSSNRECKKCGSPSEKNVCDICLWVKEISDIYTKQSNFGVLYDFNDSYLGDYLLRINLNDLNIYFINKADPSKYNEDIYVDSINQFGYGNQKFVNSLVPLKNNKILNFEEIMNLTPLKYGDRKLAILKMDVDNLGGIFAFGLKNKEEKRAQRSFSKYVTMSRLFEYFFSAKISTICKKVSEQINPIVNDPDSNGTLFYINYSGGDDLVIIGSAYSIVMLAKEINKQFSAFTHNKNITISGGIHFQNDKAPIRFGVQRAEDALEKSKTGEKNAITLIDTRVPFEEYEQLLDSVFDIVNDINTGFISRTMVHHIMMNIRDKTLDEYIRLLPKIQYVLYRNKKDENHFIKMKRLFNDVGMTDKNSNEELRLLELKLKLAIMFTREVEEKHVQ